MSDFLVETSILLINQPRWLSDFLVGSWPIAISIYSIQLNCIHIHFLWMASRLTKSLSNPLNCTGFHPIRPLHSMISHEISPLKLHQPHHLKVPFTSHFPTNPTTPEFPPFPVKTMPGFSYTKLSWCSFFRGGDGMNKTSWSCRVPGSWLRRGPGGGLAAHGGGLLCGGASLHPLGLRAARAKQRPRSGELKVTFFTGFYGDVMGFLSDF